MTATAKLSATARKSVMARAWAIFRAQYHYGSGIPFKSIGRSCFAWALQTAWHEIRREAALAAIPADVKAARIASLHASLGELCWIDSTRAANAIASQIHHELRQLAA